MNIQPFKSKFGKNKLKMQNLQSYNLQINRVDFAAGVYPICLKTKKILLCKRGPNLESEPNKWSNLGGKSNSYETPYENAAREFFEESGRYIPIKLIPSYISEKKNGFKYYNFLGIVDYEFIPLTNKITSDFEVEITDYKWLSLDEFLKFPKNKLHWGTALFREKCQKELQNWLGPK